MGIEELPSGRRFTLNPQRLIHRCGDLAESNSNDRSHGVDSSQKTPKLAPFHTDPQLPLTDSPSFAGNISVKTASPDLPTA